MKKTLFAFLLCFASLAFGQDAANYLQERTVLASAIDLKNSTRFYFRGDSIFTFYNVAQYSNTWPTIFTNLAPGPFKTPIFYNDSVAGSYATSYPSLYISEAGSVANRPPTNSHSFYFVGGGVNDLYVSTTNELIFDAISNICVYARADGHRVIASTVTPNFSSLSTAGYSNNWVALNQKIIEASNLWDGLIRADLYITNTSQTVDGLHPGRAANVILANVALRVALGLLTPEAQISDAAYSSITAKTNTMRFMWLDAQGFQVGQNATKSTGFSAGTGYYNGEPYYVDWVKLDSNVSTASVYRGLPFGIGYSNFVVTWYLVWPVASDCRMTNVFASYTHGATRTTSTGNFVNTFTNGLNLLRMTNVFANDIHPRSITYNMAQNTNGGSLYLLGAEIEWK